MRDLRWAAVWILTGAAACAPLNPGESDVIGAWRAEWTCGVEMLVLKRDGSYAYSVDFAAGGRATDSGRWKLVPTTEHLVGAHVILQNALQGCSDFGEKAAQPERFDRTLETIWEWGRMILSFNPDVPGFTRL
jgi:hypothetical protein